MSAEEIEVKKPRGRFPTRHVQTMMMFFALVICYGMRVNMSIAIVVMTDTSLENSFDWSMQTQSVILSSFFWGYIVLQIPAGEMAAKFGGMILVTTAIGVNALVSLAVPFAAYYGGWQMVCACRVVQGLAQGFVVPSIYNLIGKWTPMDEKSRTGAVINSGSQLGNAIQLLISGFIADAWGWPAIFYVNGVVGAVWVVLYIVLGSDSPQKSKWISAEERLYIQTSLGQVGEQKNGVMSALPYLAVYFLSFPFGYLSDYLPNKKYLSVTATRKLSNSIGFYGPAIALVGLSYVPAGNVTLAVVLLTIVVGLNVGHLTGLMLVHLDMAPNYVGTLLGITNGTANIISIIAPLVAGAVIHDETDPNEWRKVFYIASAVYIAGNTFYLIFGTSERQKWNEPPEDQIGNVTEIMTSY
ncbi:hypothetical protein SFRURICE_012558 [Spodoptera frugiperda]|nr:hypothetical protein SFRURICE_012558 [Spodoptera frugiperda]